MIFAIVFWAILSAAAVITGVYLLVRRDGRQRPPAVDLGAVFDGSTPVVFERVAGPDDRTLLREATSRGYVLTGSSVGTYSDIFTFVRP